MDKEEIKKTTGADDASKGAGSAEKATFDDLLKNPDYQREFDKKVSKAIEKAVENQRSKWEEDAKNKQAEAERLAKMTEAERHAEEIKKITDERVKAEKELNAYRLKAEASKIASDKGIDLSLLDLIDYDNANAETVKAKIEAIDKSYKDAVEKAVNERLKQGKPRQYKSTVLSSDEEYLNAKYGNNKYYKRK